MKSMRRMMAIMLVLGVWAAALCSAEIKKGDKAPNFTMRLSTGEKITLSSMLDKPVLLHFWATWCPPCKKELPEMDALAKKLASQETAAKMHFLAVCTSDTDKNRADFMKKNKYTFSGGTDEKAEIGIKYGIQGIPTSILIDKDGTVLNVAVGMMTSAQLKEFVKGYED